MQLLSVNIGKEQSIQHAKESGKTGIFKMPASGPVAITRDGLAGDTICDTENHGGDDQAIYAYGSADYDWWAESMGREFAPGTFGENLTISALESASMRIGDRLIIRGVVLEVTAPRIPCVTLATRMGDPAFVKRFRAAERPGLYCRVIQPGVVQAGDSVHLELYRGETVTVLEMFRFFYESNPSAAALVRQLAAPIAIRARRENEARLAQITKDSNESSHSGQR
jgi:MOSC domain-containing protein YiiM